MRLPGVDSRGLAGRLKASQSVAVEAALLAGEYVAGKFGRHRRLSLKADASLVTEVDRRSEALVLGLLRKRFPRDAIIAEESAAAGARAGTGPFRWHVDPLDGTSNFVHGFPFFCVSIGLECLERGEDRAGVVMGVIYQPITRDLYVARLGGGAYRNRERMAVSRTRRLGDAMLSTGFSFKRRQLFDAEVASFSRAARLAHAIRRTGSAALDLTLVATGQFDGFWERGLSTWDVCAGIALLSEAGGRFSRLDGRPYQLGDVGILASNGPLHGQLVRTLN